MVIPNASSHINFSVVVIILLTAKITITTDNAPLILSGSILGSLLPDIDHEKATMSKLIPFYLFHRLLKRWTKIFKHGGITHTILVNMLIFILYWWTGKDLILGLGIVYASHLYIDHIDGNKLNMLWYPLGRRK